MEEFLDIKSFKKFNEFYNAYKSFDIKTLWVCSEELGEYIGNCFTKESESQKFNSQLFDYVLESLAISKVIKEKSLLEKIDLLVELKKNVEACIYGRENALNDKEREISEKGYKNSIKQIEFFIYEYFREGRFPL